MRQDADGYFRYAPLSVFGVGAGPRAVGSMTIGLDDFAPATAARADQVHYRLTAHRSFDRATVEVLRVPAQGDTLQRVAAYPMARLSPGAYANSWSAQRVNPDPAAGAYALQVRAWVVGGGGDQRDWTGAFAPNLVRIP